MTFLPFARDGRKPRRQNRVPLLSRQSDNDDAGSGAVEGASFSGAVFNLSTTIVGAGIMALPAAVKVLGLIPGLVAIAAVGSLTETSIDFIMRVGQSPVSSSYGSIFGDATGAIGRTLLQTCVVVNNLGMLIVYMIIIGDVLSGTAVADGGVHHTGVVEGWFGHYWWCERSFLIFLTTAFVLSPLISFKRIDSLRYTSALSVALAVVFVVTTAGIAIVKMIDGSIGMPRLLPKLVDQASFWNLFTTIPVIVTAYICHYSVHPIENELKDATQMKSIVRVSLGLCTVVYIATSFFGFLLFGEETLDDVLANFDADLGLGLNGYSSLLNDVVRVSYTVHLMLVFPVIFFSLRLNLDALLFPLRVPLAFDGRRFFAITVGLMGLVFVGATFVPNIWVVFQFTGATAAIAIGFIFPSVIVIRDVHGVAKKRDKALSWLMILLGFASSIIAISSNVYGLFGSGDRS